MKYDEIAKTAPKGNNDFYRLQDGENRVRIVSEPEIIGRHWIQSERKYYTCVGKDSGCRYCAGGNEPSPKYLYYVIDRADAGKIKIAEFGWSIVGTILELRKDTDYAFEDVPDYDIKIKKTGTGKETEYFVLAAPKTALTSEEEGLVMAKRSLIELVEGIKAKAKEEHGGHVDPAGSSTDVSDEELGFKRSN